MTMALSAGEGFRAWQEKVQDYQILVGDHWQELSKDYPYPIHTLSNRGGTRLRSDRNDRILKIAKSHCLWPQRSANTDITVMVGAQERRDICASNPLSPSTRLESLS